MGLVKHFTMKALTIKRKRKRAREKERHREETRERQRESEGGEGGRERQSETCMESSINRRMYVCMYPLEVGLPKNASRST